MEIQAELGNTVIMITHDVDEAVLLSDRIVMMTNGPAATIGDILAVDLERPRDRLALAEEPAFNHLRQQVLEFLYAKQTNPADKSEKHGPQSASNIEEQNDEVAPQNNSKEPALVLKVNNDNEAA